MTNYIGVLDCNNFFVSCERLFRPDLAHKPVVVLSNNDGCVVARSQEIKDIGIAMGTPLFQIKDILKKVDAQVFSSNFTLYRDISRRVFLVIRDRLSKVEQYSIDEAFFELKEDSILTAETICCKLQRVVEHATGIPVSIGVGMTKTQAKYANHLAKKVDKPVILTTDWWQQNATHVRLQDIWGIGGQLLIRYREAGITTVADLQACPQPRLDSLFGIAGMRLLEELSGQSIFTIKTIRVQRKTIMSSSSFKSTTSDLSILKDAVAHHVRQVMAEIRQRHLVTSRIQISVDTDRYGDYFLYGGTKESYLVVPTADTTTILREALRLVDSLFMADVPYKKVGIRVSELFPYEQVQPSLFCEESCIHTELSTVTDQINERFGQTAIVLGRHSLYESWRAKSDYVSPSYTTSWSDIPVVTLI